MKFSIVIPVYNVVAELPRTIESLKRQTFDDFEIVLVDDGSTDGSSELVDTYSNVATVIHQANQGAMVARRNGLEVSKGEWIFFVDGDDTIKPESLRLIKEELDRTNGCLDIVCFGFDVIYGKRRIPHPVPLRGNYSTDELLIRKDKTPDELMGSCIGTKCYRRDVLKSAFASISDVNISFHEDALLAFSAFLMARSIGFLTGCFYEYVQRANSLRNRFNDNVVNEEDQFVFCVGNLARASGRLSSEQIGRCLDAYCQSAAIHVFHMFIANRVKYQVCYNILCELNNAQFFMRFKCISGSHRKNVVLFLLSHPRMCCLILPFLHYANVMRKMMRKCYSVCF